MRKSSKRSAISPPLVMASRRQVPLSLTPELWANVFAFLDKTDRPFESWESWDFKSSRELQQRLELRRVCKVFDAVHATHLQRLTVQHGLSDMAMPRLLAWLRRSKPLLTSVQVGSSESSVVAGVLATLACMDTPPWSWCLLSGCSQVVR